MFYSQDTADPSEKKCSDIMTWLLAILEVVNSDGKLAPQKAIQKLLEEWVDNYGPETCWRGIKHFSKNFRMADDLSVEALFQSHPDLPSILQNEERAKKAFSQWLEDNSEKVYQAHQLLCGLGKLVPRGTISKFAEGGVTPEQQEILGETFLILGKERNDEEGSSLR